MLLRLPPAGENAAMTEPLDLTGCDREPIHIPGSIQPHGALLVIEDQQLTIVQAAGCVQAITGRQIAAVLGRKAAEVVRSVPESVWRSMPGIGREPALIGTYGASGGGSFDMMAHRRNGAILLEFEPRASQPVAATTILGEVRRALGAFETAATVQALLQAAAEELRRVTGFDRVMVYRFLDDGTGAVLAEAKLASLAPFLHHHYPASDIPQQARALYLRNLIRVIPDVSYTPAPLIAAPSAVVEPLDMTDCALRSVSPIHVQYLKNMAVGASMSVSIVVERQLWGLIACHHCTAKFVAYEVREHATHLGRMLGAQLEAREEVQRHREAARLSIAREQLVADVGHAATVEQGLLDHASGLMNAVQSDGVAVIVDDKVAASGHTATSEEIRALGQWLATQPDQFVSHALSQMFAPAQAYPDRASGLLATRIGGEHPIQLLWFRAERVQVINWAGNPHKAVESGDTPMALTPRRSFATWAETVRNQALPWSAAEQHSAQQLASALFDLGQEFTLRALNVQLRRTVAEKETLLTQKDLLMQEVNHRVQNSLQLVNSMLALQSRYAATSEVRGHFDEASRRVLAISALHGRLWRSQQIERVDLATYLSELGEGLVATWGLTWREHLKVSGRSVFVPTGAAVVLGLLVSELLTNAVKYAYAGAPGPVEVGVREERGTAVRVVVSDRGGGVRDNTRRGLGSRLTDALMAQLNGTVEMQTSSAGTIVTLCVPLNASKETAS
jgi:chemotaxis family two-component system sensor kinase Cph1